MRLSNARRPDPAVAGSHGGLCAGARTRENGRMSFEYVLKKSNAPAGAQIEYERRWSPRRMVRDCPAAKAHLEEAATISEALGKRSMLRESLNYLGWVLSVQGDRTSGREHYEVASVSRTPGTGMLKVYGGQGDEQETSSGTTISG